MLSRNYELQDMCDGFAIKVLAAKAGSLNLRSRTYIVEEPTPTSYPDTTCALWHTHSPLHTLTKNN